MSCRSRVFVVLFVVFISALTAGFSKASHEEVTVLIFGRPPDEAEIIETYPDAYLCRISKTQLNYLKYRNILYYLVDDNIISLDFITIDITEPIILPPELTIGGYEGEYGYYIVKLRGPPHPDWISALDNYGTIYGYIPHYAYLMKVRNVDVNNIMKEKFVRWVGIYQPAYKLESREMLHGEGKVKYTVLLYPEADRDKVAEFIKLLGGNVIIPNDRSSWFKILHVEIDASQLARIARIEDVMYIQITPEFKLHNDVAARIVNAYFAWEFYRNRIGIDLDGNGQIIGFADSGLDTGNLNNIHEDFQGRVVHYYYYNSFFDTQGDGLGHGTHVAGSIAGSGYLSELYMGLPVNDDNYDMAICGMAPEARLVVGEIFTDGGQAWGLFFYSISDILDDAYNSGARIHTNSWGARTNSYDANARAVDEYAWSKKDYLILFAAGNSGPNPNTVGSPGTAKNCITVGATENNRPEFGSNADNINEMASFSSRGPTADNRIKPDVSAPGTWILSARSSIMQQDICWGPWPWDADNDGKQDYCFMGGTSMATPITAGIAALVRQYYVEVCGVTPSSALLKATIINGAVDMGYGYPSNDQGWGRVDIKNTLFPDPPKTWKYWDVSRGISTGSKWTISLDVKSSDIPLRITLVWTDYPASANANPALVNNLDLVVKDPRGRIYYGNVFSNSWSQPNASSRDSLNNVENVFVKSPERGIWQIEVVGNNVPQGPQPFAIVVRGALGAQSDHYVAITSTENWMRIVRPGSQDTFTINVYNYGRSSDTISLSATAVPGVTVTFSQSSVSLNSEGKASIIATINVDNSIREGSYDIKIQATSNTKPSIKDEIVFKLVVRSINVPSPISISSEMEHQSDFDVFVKSGTIYIAYVSGEDGGKTIYLRYSSDGVNWQKERVSSASKCEMPDVWVDDSNNIIVVWLEENSIKLRYKSGTSWSSEIVLGSASDPNYPRVDEPTIAQDRHGYIWVFYKDLSVSNNVGYWNIKYVRSSAPNNPSSFSSPANAPFTDTSKADYVTDAYRARDGTLWVAYYQRDPNANPSYRYIRYARYDGSSWTYGNVETSSMGENYYPGVYEDSSGRIWFVWYSTRGGSYQIYAAYYSGGSWSSTRGPIGNLTPYSPPPTLVELTSGLLGIVFIEYDNPYGAGNVMIAKSSDDFNTYTIEYLTADALVKSMVRAVVINDELWCIYSSITFKGGEWSGIGELNAKNDADLYLIRISALPEFVSPNILIMLVFFVVVALIRVFYKK